MTTDIRPLRRVGAARGLMRATLTALCVTGAMLLPNAASASAATIVYEPVNEAAFVHDLDSGQVVSVRINKRGRTVKATLRDGSHVSFKYGKHREPQAYALVKSHGVPVTILSEAEAKAEAANKPVHHKIRYIVGGVLIVVIVIVAAVLLINRRRRRREEEWPVGPGAPGSGGAPGPG
ncbi:MAG TPA: hypothetical protein VMB51_14380 [Solirubrobacteraceae bacterium]|nr:hypothetical protein [Solirubrobacteraceae bacterium]